MTATGVMCPADAGYQIVGDLAREQRLDLLGVADISPLGRSLRSLMSAPGP